MEVPFKYQILNSIVREITIIVELSTRVKPENEHVKLFEEARSIKELLHYLTWCSVSTAHYYIDDNTTLQQSYQLYESKYASYPISQFAAAMFAQFKEIRILFTKIEDQDLKTKQVKVAWGETMTMGEAMLHTTVKYLTAYRMQLFLSLKMAGEKDLDTIDCWIGKRHFLREQEELKAIY